MKRLALVLVAAFGALLLLAGPIAAPASAHAVLESSDPGADTVVSTLPGAVSLTFSESVSLVPGSLRVYGPDGARIDRGDVDHPGGHGDRIGVSIGDGDDAGQGTFLVAWRVISADSHPMSGAFTFSVGHASRAPVAPSVHSSRPLGIALGVARWTGYLGSALLIGILIVIGWCWRAGWSSTRARRLMVAGGVLLAVGSVASLLLKGPYDAALGLGATFRGELIREVVGTTYGRATIARIVLALVGLVLVWRRVRSLRVAGALAAAVGVSFALAGHAAAGDGRVVASLNDTVHVVAASTWLGGLVVLAVAVLPQRDSDASRLAVSRFSGLALALVLALVCTGLYQAIRQVGSLGALTGTTYGRELLVKIAIVLVVLALAQLSRRRLAAGDTPLRAVVAAEAALVLAILGVTASLVATEPAKTAYRPTISASLTVLGQTVDVTAVPTGSRAVDLHVYVLDASGQPAEPEELTASIGLPDKQIEALPVPLTLADPGHWRAPVSVPVAGDWRLAITVRTTEIDEATGYATLTIR